MDQGQIDNLPINSREYKNPPNEDPHDGAVKAPDIGEAPKSKSDLVAQGSPLDKGSAIDLAALKHVQPPPYTFSGNSKNPVPWPADRSTESLTDPRSVAVQAEPAIARELFQSAMRAYQESRYADAEGILQDVVSTSDSTEAQYFLGVCRLMMDKNREAIEPLRLVVNDRTSRYRQAAHFYLGKAFLRLDEWPEAESHLEQAKLMKGPLTTEAGLMLQQLRALSAQQK